MTKNTASRNCQAKVESRLLLKKRAVWNRCYYTKHDTTTRSIIDKLVFRTEKWLAGRK
jgi:hypothetical protein